jgi:signal peptidase I
MTAEDHLSELSPQPAPQSPPSTPHHGFTHFLLDLLETVALSIVLFLAINAVSARVRVDGFSMLPTLHNNQYVLVNRLAGQYQRGDIIVFRPPMYPPEDLARRLFGLPGLEEDYIKRVIGLPGDVVKVEAGKVYVNDAPLKEAYIAAQPNYTGKWEVPQGNLFVLGDNRNDSSDSHTWGFVPIENVLGRATLVYWPFADWMVIRNNRPALAAP